MKNKTRCEWVAAATPLEIEYHDSEWGVPLHDDKKLFELLVLEGAQAGLSWRTILYKRENYRRAFDDYDLEKIVRYRPARVARILKDPGIVRHALKINSVITNAQNFQKIQKEFGTFANYLWAFVEHRPIIGKKRNVTENALSQKISKDLKRRGFKFVGGTIMYSYMQACGMINDHDSSCFRKAQLKP